VLLVYGRSSAVEAGLLGAHKEGTAFRVIVVDSRPKFEGKQLLEVPPAPPHAYPNLDLDLLTCKLMT
jgi:hypothetical protein